EPVQIQDAAIRRPRRLALTRLHLVSEFAPLLSRQDEQVDRKSKSKLQCSIDPARSPPADETNEIGGERPTDRAGKTAEERERCDRLSRLVTVGPPEGCEGGIVQS